MKLRNLLHIQEDDIHIIGSFMPPFFYRISDIMVDFIQLCDNNKVEKSLYLLKEKYSEFEFKEFQQRLDKIKDKLFVDDNYKDYIEFDLSHKISILTLNATRKCNLKCSYCFENSEYRKLGDMSFATAKKAIDIFFKDKDFNWVIIFTGGEPILNFKLLKKVVEYVYNQGLKVEYRIKTNATLLDDDKMDFMIKNNFRIQVSLDGSEKAHNTHRKFADGKDSFEIVNKAINRLIEKGTGSKVSISGTLTHQTTQYIDDCYAQLNSYHGIKSYCLKGVMPNSHHQHVLDLNDHKISYLSNLRNNRYLMQQGKKLIDTKDNLNICGIGIWHITIDVDGSIYPCYRMCGDHRYIIGHLNALQIPFKLPRDLENIYCLENNKQCAKCYLINVCKMGCYTDKLMHQYDKDQCFQSTKQISDEIFRNEFINKRIYLSLDIV